MVSLIKAFKHQIFNTIGLVLFFLIIYGFSCNFKDNTTVPTNKKISIDSTMYKRVDSLKNENFQLRLKLSEAKDSIQKLNTTVYNDSINDLYIPYSVLKPQNQVEKVLFYITICEKRKENKKFFYGWMKRVFKKELLERGIR